jgi:hypothetical protein
MFHPLPIFLGLRYVRTRGRGFFVSFISWVSMLVVCLGVAALITIISLMNGFEGELRGRLVALTAHARERARRTSTRPVGNRAAGVRSPAGRRGALSTSRRCPRGCVASGAAARYRACGGSGRRADRAAPLEVAPRTKPGCAG